MSVYRDGNKYVTPTLLNFSLNVENFIYPIARVLRNRIIEMGMDAKEYAAKYHYENFLFGSEIKTKYIKMMSKFIKVDDELFNQATEDTELLMKLENYSENIQGGASWRKYEMEKQRTFKPFIVIKTTLSKPDVRFTMVPKNHAYLDPDISLLSYEFQLQTVKSWIFNDYKRWKGKLPHYGDITGYYYQMEYNTTVELDHGGNEIRIIKNFQPKKNYL